MRPLSIFRFMYFYISRAIWHHPVFSVQCEFSRGNQSWVTYWKIKGGVFRLICGRSGSPRSNAISYCERKRSRRRLNRETAVYRTERSTKGANSNRISLLIRLISVRRCLTRRVVQRQPGFIVLAVGRDFQVERSIYRRRVFNRELSNIYLFPGSFITRDVDVRGVAAAPIAHRTHTFGQSRAGNTCPQS